MVHRQGRVERKSEFPYVSWMVPPQELKLDDQIQGKDQTVQEPAGSAMS